MENDPNPRQYIFCLPLALTCDGIGPEEGGSNIEEDTEKEVAAAPQGRKVPVQAGRPFSDPPLPMAMARDKG